LEVGEFGGAGDADNVIALGQYPGQGNLRGFAAFLGRNVLMACTSLRLDSMFSGRKRGCIPVRKSFSLVVVRSVVKV